MSKEDFVSRLQEEEPSSTPVIKRRRLINRDQFICSSTGLSVTKYNEEFHIGLLFDVFSVGRTVKHYIVDADIDEKTFYTWLKVHPAFKKAHERAKLISLQFWEELPLFDANFNYKYWEKIGRVRHGYGKERLGLDLSGDPEDNMTKIIEGVNLGQIHPEEASLMSSLVTTKIKAKDSKEISGLYGSMNGDQKVAALEAYIAQKEK